MAEHVVERFEIEALRFHGDLLIASKTEPIDSATGARWLQLVLYQCDDGGFVSMAEFCTDVDGERHVVSAERLDTSTDAENFFFAFEPEEFLNRAGVNLPPVERQQLAAELYSRYEFVVREILAELPSSEGKESRQDAANVNAAGSGKGTAE